MNRRSFLKTVTGAVVGVVAAAVIPYRPSFPEVEAQSAIKPKPKHPKDVLCCRDFSPAITIQEYSPGDTVSYQSLAVDPECSACAHESYCTGNGKKFVKQTKELIHEYWSKKLQKQWYENSNLGNL